MRLFADTSAWVAYFDRDDMFHHAARLALTSLRDQRVTFLTSDYVLDETITMLSSYTGHRVAVAFGDWVQSERRVQIVRVNEELWQAAWQLFKRYHDKKFSFTDCTSFVLMQRQGLVDVFGFDHHFEQMGFRLWPHK